MIEPKAFALFLGCAMSFGATAQCLTDTEAAALCRPPRGGPAADRC